MTTADSRRIRIDRDACIGAGLCVTIDDTVFDQDDDGIVILLQTSPADRQEVRDAVASCPTRALSFVDDTA